MCIRDRSIRRQEFLGRESKSLEQSACFAATAGRRFRTVQATFKVISFRRDRGAFVTLCFQCAVYKLIFFTYLLIDHPQSGVYNCGRVCLYVCLSVLSDDNFRKPWRREFIFAHPVYLQAILVMFVYESHRIKVKVTGVKKVEYSLFPQSSLASNSAIL